MSVRAKFLALEQELNQLSLERESLVRVLLLGLLSQEHVFVLGPPGADKSRLISTLMNRVEDADCFSVLLTRFTTPEEVLGPLSIPALERGIYQRVTQGMLPKADLAFLDEIFKAGSAILNSLLRLLNERQFRDAGKLCDSPLQTVFAASNELGQAEELGPLYDRLLLRVRVDYLAEESNVTHLLEAKASVGPPPLAGAPTPTPVTLTLADMQLAQGSAAAVGLPGEVLQLMLGIRADLRRQGLSVSDRRFLATTKLVKAEAWLNGHSTALPCDVEVLAHALWSEPSEQRLVTTSVLRRASPLAAKALRLRDLAAEQRDLAVQPTGSTESERAEAMTKLKGLVDSLSALRDQAANSDGVPPRVDRALKQVQAMRREVLRECLGVEC
tara:strand:+ start:602 stop:1759 length:1158 start_codon:yes stop_codon:yes gene_type:complete